jgi:preprotein translocase subunit SecE
MNRQQRRQSRRQEQGADPGSGDDGGVPANVTFGVDVPVVEEEFDAETSSVTPSRTAAPSRQHSGPRQFLHEVNVEMRKVAWPTRSETLNYSTVVFVTLAILMALIFVLDLGFTHVAGFLFNP